MSSVESGRLKKRKQTTLKPLFVLIWGTFLKIHFSTSFLTSQSHKVNTNRDQLKNQRVLHIFNSVITDHLLKAFLAHCSMNTNAGVLWVWEVWPYFARWGFPWVGRAQEPAARGEEQAGTPGTLSSGDGLVLLREVDKPKYNIKEGMSGLTMSENYLFHCQLKWTK